RRPDHARRPARRAPAGLGLTAMPHDRSRPPVPAEKPTEAKRPTFPARDGAGRIATVRDMVVGVVAWVAGGGGLLIALAGLVSLAAGGFGHISGWIAGALAVLMFIEDFRAWRVGPGRIAVALLGVALGALAGIVLVGQLGTVMPAVFS